MLDSNTCNHLTVCKKKQYLIVNKQISSNFFENIIT